MTMTGAPQPPDGQGPAPQAPYPQAPRTNTLAIVSFASAFFASIVAVITGHIALGQIGRSRESGRGLAVAGLVLGYLGLAATTFAVVLAIAFAATLGAFLAAVGAGTNTGSPSDSSSTAPEPALPTGRLGAANFDEGYLAVGTGAVTIDVYFDPMCPYCGQFEQTNGAVLAEAVAVDAITLRLHSLTFLDRASQGTNYSTRASAALTCEATLNPESTLDYLSALFADQPAENTAGRSDAELAALSTGVVGIEDCIADGEYQRWSQVNTEKALSGPIPDAEIASIPGTPTVLVDGLVYGGSLTDAREFADFAAAAF